MSCENKGRCIKQQRVEVWAGTTIDDAMKAAWEIFLSGPSVRVVLEFNGAQIVFENGGSK